MLINIFELFINILINNPYFCTGNLRIHMIEKELIKRIIAEKQNEGYENM